MASRYSGDVRIEIAYVDARSQYKATVSERGQRRWSGWIRPPASQKGSVDSAANYDDAAGAALSFAMHSVNGLDASVAWPLDGGTRPMLSRSAPKGRSSGDSVLRTEYESALFIDGKPSMLKVTGLALTEEEFRRNARRGLAPNVRLVGKVRVISRSRIVPSRPRKKGR